MSCPWTRLSDAVHALKDAPRHPSELAVCRQQLLRLRDEAMASVLRPANVAPVRTQGEILVNSLRRVRQRRRAARARLAKHWERTLGAPKTSRVQEHAKIDAMRRNRLSARLVARPAAPFVALNRPEVGPLALAPGWADWSERWALARTAVAQSDQNQSFLGWNSDFFQYAINDVKVYKDGYGDPNDILSDINRLGAVVIRHPGFDLTLDQMISTRGTLLDAAGDSHLVVRLPLVDEMKGEVLLHYDDMVKMLRALDTHGLSAVLTLVHMGAGENLTVDIDLGGRAEAGVRKAIAILWDDDHKNTGVNIDGQTWGDYSLEGLDLRSEYQIRYLEAYVRRICELLSAIESKDFSIAGLGSVIAGLELFNEVDIRNIRPYWKDPDQRYGDTAAHRTARSWASVVYRLTSIVEEVLGPQMPILLPGLSSFDGTTEFEDPEGIGYIHTWSWQKAYIGHFLDEFGALYNADVASGIRNNVGPYVLATTLDLHHYHKQEKSAKDKTLGPLHIGRLAWQMDQLREILDSRSFGATLITVLELGASATADEYMPELAPDRPTWQAWEVWRRLAGGLASGAPMVGWHCWRSLPGGNFSGTGLRYDQSGSVAMVPVSEEVPPEEAYQRKSWFAYQRFTSILRYPNEVRFLLPVDELGDTLVKVDENSAAEQDVVVIEFRGLLQSPDGSWYPYGYVIFVDGWRGTEDSFRLDAVPDRGADVQVQRVATVSRPILRERGFPGKLPNTTATFRLPGLGTDVQTKTLAASGSSWVAALADGPGLLLSKAPLRWSLR